MRTHFIIIIVAIALLGLFVSCHKTIKKDNIDNNTIDYDSIKANNIDTPSKGESIVPKILLFKYSKCIQNCSDPERIISKKYNNDTLFLKIGSIQNCIGNFRLELEMTNGSLNLDIKVKESIIKRKNGKIDTLLITEECDCYYYFDICISNLKTELKTILINGQKFGRKQKGQGDQIIIKQ